MKLLVTFGQNHAHRVNGFTYDKDVVARIECKDYGHGREIAHKLFGNEFGTSYEEGKLDMVWFPRGTHDVEESGQELTDFETWWYNEGSQIKPVDGDDFESHARRVAKIAWSNGAYKANNS